MTARIHAFINGYIRGLVRTSEKRLVDDLRLPVCIWGSLAASLQGHIGRCYLRMVRFIGQKLTANETGDRDPPMTAIIHMHGDSVHVYHIHSPVVTVTVSLQTLDIQGSKSIWLSMFLTRGDAYTRSKMR